MTFKLTLKAAWISMALAACAADRPGAKSASERCRSYLQQSSKARLQ